ncbi:hypothetical protein F4804DRAFT_161063 [Jackrogersella minutella]|nr:hypothetical protein F4804DRAFT_161063 [Jackrogersella minutella]
MAFIGRDRNHFRHGVWTMRKLFLSRISMHQVFKFVAWPGIGPWSNEFLCSRVGQGCMVTMFIVLGFLSRDTE